MAYFYVIRPKNLHYCPIAEKVIFPSRSPKEFPEAHLFSVEPMKLLFSKLRGHFSSECLTVRVTNATYHPFVALSPATAHKQLPTIELCKVGSHL